MAVIWKEHEVTGCKLLEAGNSEQRYAFGGEEEKERSWYEQFQQGLLAIVLYPVGVYAHVLSYCSVSYCEK